MKKITLLLALFITFLSYGQDSIRISPTTIAPVVVDVEGKSAAELFTKTKEWINTYYKNPKEVVKAEIENQMVRFEGFCSNCWVVKTMGMEMYHDLSYTVEIDFKEGKYRYNVSNTKFSDDGKPFMYDYTSFYKKDGELRKMYVESKKTMEATLNSTHFSLFNYIAGKQKSDW